MNIFLNKEWKKINQFYLIETKILDYVIRKRGVMGMGKNWESQLSYFLSFIINYFIYIFFFFFSSKIDAE